ncbi:esterase [Cnuibacter physcomitrellae]|uniref:Alpha/beta hydrolase n=1 Tax=Cnuibacter physcomitrellae TaxID=1619308 RepID=A0A1X9LL08_9MICO|nr:alpha/beta hydrolase [Cnuibacter physcomitrellae]ARJ05896.1 alpha/beta hydrolase [Cnuibacter physcomitrellae]GGI36742.1 esterase [Cnuibacter physcomitrellae]
MATLVLVHGAMHGGWAWSPVARLLRERGHEVHAPTLTGQGDRRAELTPAVGVSTHVRDLTELLWFEDLHDVVLVLHSYAGVLAGPVVETCSGRIRSVVFAGAFYVRPGQRLLDVEPPAVAERYTALAREQGDGWRLPATTAFLSQWAVTDPAMQAFVGPRLTDFPFKAQTDAVDFDPGPLLSIPRTYIEHTAPPLPSLAVSQEAALADGATHVTLETGHDMMLAAPEATAALLESLV